MLMPPTPPLPIAGMAPFLLRGYVILFLACNVAGFLLSSSECRDQRQCLGYGLTIIWLKPLDQVPRSLTGKTYPFSPLAFDSWFGSPGTATNPRFLVPLIRVAPLLPVQPVGCGVSLAQDDCRPSSVQKDLNVPFRLQRLHSSASRAGALESGAAPSKAQGSHQRRNADLAYQVWCLEITHWPCV